MAILKLSATQARNQFGNNLRGSRKGMREATASKHDRGLLLPVIFGLLFIAIASNSCYQAVHGLARYARDQWPGDEATGDVIEVSHSVHFHLSFRTRHPLDQDGGGEQTPGDQEKLAGAHNLISVLEAENGGDQEAAKERALELLAHLDQHGIDGFVVRRTNDLYKFIDARELSAEARSWFGRVLAIVIGFLAVALTLMPLSARNKDLGSLDLHLAWLFCLPLTGREILSGRFTAMVLVKPLAWLILWPLFTMLFISMGYAWLSPLYALVATFALSAATAGIELAVETWMRTAASFRLKKNVQSLATIFGTLAFIMAIAAGVAASRSVAWINWILDHSPEWITSIPGKLIEMPIDGPQGMLTFLASLVAASTLCAVSGWSLSAHALRLGLSGGNDRSGARSKGAGTAARSTSLARFEWLLLMRDRNLATMVLVVPLIMVFYQVLINPQLLENMSAQKLAVFGFGCGVWAATTTAPHVLMSETNSLWMIFSLPVSIAEHFERRTRAWRTSGTLMAAAVITGLALWKGFPKEEWWRIPAGLAGVWVISLVVYAIMMGNAKLPDTTKGERPKISVGRIYGCMLIGGLVGATIWHGTAWQIFTSLILWWFFGFGMWQSVSRRLQFLLEPTEATQPQLTLASAISALIVFFVAQALSLALLAGGLPHDLPAAMLYSYTIGGIAALAYCGFRLIDHRLPETAPSPTKLAIALPLWTLACISVGAIWITMLRSVPPLRSLQETAESAAAIQVDVSSWQIVLLATVAAPIIEELVFRGFVLRIMQTIWSTRSAVFANALLFAVVHPALSFPAVFLLGLGCATLYTKTQRVWPCIVLHAIYNAAIVAMQ